MLYFPKGQEFPQPETEVVILGAAAPPDEPVDPEDPATPPTTTRVTQVTYVYEKDSAPIPREVAKALADINAKYAQVVASEFEDDNTNGPGEVPIQYRVAVGAAKSAGLPCLVVQKGATVAKVVAKPTTEAQVLEALK